MVEKQGRQWLGFAFGHADLERVAVTSGTKGAGARRRAKHEQERSLDITMAILRKIYPRYLWETNKDIPSSPNGQSGRQLPLSTGE